MVTKAQKPRANTLPSRTVIPGQSVRVSTQAVAIPVPGTRISSHHPSELTHPTSASDSHSSETDAQNIADTSGREHSEAVIDLLREDGEIRHVNLVCKCGEH